MDNKTKLKGALPGLLTSFVVIGLAWLLDADWKGLILIVCAVIFAWEVYYVLWRKRPVNIMQPVRSMGWAASLITTIHLLMVWLGNVWGVVVGVFIGVMYILWRRWRLFMDGIMDVEQQLYGMSLEEYKARRRRGR